MAITTSQPVTSKGVQRKPMSRVQQDAIKLISVGAVFAIMTVIAILFVAPMLYMTGTSLKSADQMADPGGTISAFPLSNQKFLYQGKELPLYKVPTNSGLQVMALLSSSRSKSVFIDPAHPETAPVELAVRPATLEKVMTVEPHSENYGEAMKAMKFSLALRNTTAITIISMIGAVISAAFVAYGFSRFNIPGGNIMFMLLMATIILPPQVTLIPTFIVFQKIGWVGTVLQLIVPHFFSNAYNVFLLRQYFMTIPTEMDEAAKVDGANPIQTFLQVIVPQARPALITVCLFHFLVIWSEFYNAFIFTSGNEAAQPLSVALSAFQQQYSYQPNTMMAGALLTTAAPIVIFFLAQRYFMQNIVFTGVDK